MTHGGVTTLAIHRLDGVLPRDSGTGSRTALRRTWGSGVLNLRTGDARGVLRY